MFFKIKKASIITRYSLHTPTYTTVSINPYYFPHSLIFIPFYKLTTLNVAALSGALCGYWSGGILWVGLKRNSYTADENCHV